MKLSYTNRNLLQGCAIVFVAILSGCDNSKFFTVKSETIRVDSLDQIIELQDSLVRPVIYTNLNGLDKLSFSKAKNTFISAVLPSILIAKHKIDTQRNKFLMLREKKVWDQKDSLFFLEVKNQYKAKNSDDLLSRMVTLPNSLVLAQAAVETGWGSSRFFVQGSNLFGIWSTDAHESRIPAGRLRGKKIIYLKSYADMSVSVTDYFWTLARARAYRKLRAASLETADPFKLVSHLKYYSEQKSKYVAQLKKIILQNDLTKYDRFKIDSRYLVEE